MITPEQIFPYKRYLMDYAINYAPKEMCGLFVRRGQYIQFNILPNSSLTPDETFVISPFDYAIIEASCDEVLAVFHSHPQQTDYDFTEVDKASCEATGIDWVLFHPASDEIKIIQPSGYIAEYLNRPFVYGIFDCYSLVKDILKKDKNILLADYPRGDNVLEFQQPGWNMFVENFQNEGFLELSPRGVLQKYDVLLFQIGSSKLNHVAIVWDTNRNIMYHHLAHRFSSATVFGGNTYRPGKKLRHHSLF